MRQRRSQHAAAKHGRGSVRVWAERRTPPAEPARFERRREDLLLDERRSAVQESDWDDRLYAEREIDSGLGLPRRWAED